MVMNIIRVMSNKVKNQFSNYFSILCLKIDSIGVGFESWAQKVKEFRLKEPNTMNF